MVRLVRVERSSVLVSRVGVVGVASRVPVLVLVCVVLLDMVVLGRVRVPGVWVL